MFVILFLLTWLCLFHVLSCIFSNLFEILGPICVCLFLLVAIFYVMCGNCVSIMSLIGTL